MKFKKYKKIFFKVLFLTIFSLILLFFISKKFNSYNLINLELPNYICQEEIYSDQELKAEVYFNNHFETNTFSQKIISNIQGAKKSIEIAMYSFSLENIKQEIYQAAKRGVKITIIFDQEKEEQHNIIFSNLPVEIKRLDLKTFRSCMHHKFIIIDQGEKNAKLMTSSLNWTDWQEEFDPGFLFTTTDQKIIKTFNQEFDRLKNSINGTKKFKERKYRPWAKKINYLDCFMDIWFSPGIKTNSINQKIIDLIDDAKQSIEIMVWQITDFNIVNAISKQINNGVNVKIITDDYNLWKEDSAIKQLLNNKKPANLSFVDDTWHTLDLNNEIPEILKGENFNSFFHHHALLIDKKLILFGTNNWSYSANLDNDENIIITDNKKIVSEFLETFDFFYQKFRNNDLSAKIEGNTFFLTPNENFQNKNLIILSSKNISLEEKPLICFQEKIKNNYEFKISEKCKSIPLNVFIYDDNLKVMAGNIIIPNK